jgi:hypothetical protein
MEKKTSLKNLEGVFKDVFSIFAKSKTSQPFLGLDKELGNRIEKNEKIRANY